MMQPLVTADYNHVVVIDTQVILEAKPLDQLPWGNLFPGTVLLLLVRQVQTEIDAKKNDGRLGKRARAFNRLVDSFIETRVPAPVLASPRIDVATVASHRIDWDALDDLDRNDPDDRIVAQALNAIVDDLSRLVLLSHDMRPRDAASSHGLRTRKLPETWLRDPEPSPDQRRISDLEGKVRLLSVDQPQLSVRLEVLTPEPWRYLEAAEATIEQTRAMIVRELASIPSQPWCGPPDFQNGGTYDHTHAERLEAWAAVIREDIPLMHRGLTKMFAQHRVLVTISNDGSVSAEGLSLEIRSGNTLLHSVPYGVLTSGPPAPCPSAFSGIFSGFNRYGLLPRQRKPFRFYWDERGPGDHLMLSCASFRQGRSHNLEISIELLAGSMPKAQIEAIVTASNMKGDERRSLLVDVERVVTPFDGVYNVEKATLEIRPPFDFIGNLENYGCSWFRNGGTKA